MPFVTPLVALLASSRHGAPNSMNRLASRRGLCSTEPFRGTRAGPEFGRSLRGGALARKPYGKQTRTPVASTNVTSSVQVATYSPCRQKLQSGSASHVRRQ